MRKFEILGAARALASAVAVAAIGMPAGASESPGCDIHIWQRGIYASEAGSAYGAFGALGAALQAGHDRKYPPASIVELMEQEFDIDALPVVLRGIPWRDYTGFADNRIVFEHGVIDDAAFKALKRETGRRQASPSDCYVEIYIGKQTFAGGSLKSHLFSDFYARTFFGNKFAAKTAIMFKQTRDVRISDAESLDAARATFRAALVDTLMKFLQAKLPRR